MNQIQHLECEIAEFKIELENHHTAIANLNRLVDNAERKLEDLKRKETLEKYKPQLEGYVDEYIDKIQVEHPLDPTKKLYTKGSFYNDFPVILKHLKMLKENGYLIYLYKIFEPTSTQKTPGISYIAYKPEEE
jgi:hypothetical protein